MGMAANTGHQGDFGFLRSASIGFLLAFGVIASASIGLPFLVAGVLVGALTHHPDRHWTAGLGFLAGVGVVGITIGVIGAVPAATLWIVAGLLMILGASSAFWWLRCRVT